MSPTASSPSSEAAALDTAAMMTRQVREQPIGPQVNEERENEDRAEGRDTDGNRPGAKEEEGGVAKMIGQGRGRGGGDGDCAVERGGCCEGGNLSEGADGGRGVVLDGGASGEGSREVPPDGEEGCKSEAPQTFSHMPVPRHGGEGAVREGEGGSGHATESADRAGSGTLNFGRESQLGTSGSGDVSSARGAAMADSRTPSLPSSALSGFLFTKPPDEPDMCTLPSEIGAIMSLIAPAGPALAELAPSPYRMPVGEPLGFFPESIAGEAEQVRLQEANLDKLDSGGEEERRGTPLPEGFQTGASPSGREVNASGRCSSTGLIGDGLPEAMPLALVQEGSPSQVLPLPISRVPIPDNSPPTRPTVSQLSDLLSLSSPTSKSQSRSRNVSFASCDMASTSEKTVAEPTTTYERKEPPSDPFPAAGGESLPPLLHDFASVASPFTVTPSASSEKEPDVPLALSDCAIASPAAQPMLQSPESGERHMNMREAEIQVQSLRTGSSSPQSLLHHTGEAASSPIVLISKEPSLACQGVPVVPLNYSVEACEERRRSAPPPQETPPVR
eukprot:TRINITY_DN61_c2_g1_i1.p1 TRINITY_DN61_c2_g1~~TRINITY_DN61_c2_g1_i1.p1  ORF type:complete len:621 (-),score=122.75 TRINITY_DN61_c2_g1_i1:1059-2738(-)